MSKIFDKYTFFYQSYDSKCKIYWQLDTNIDKHLDLNGLEDKWTCHASGVRLLFCVSGWLHRSRTQLFA